MLRILKSATKLTPKSPVPAMFQEACVGGLSDQLGSLQQHPNHGRDNEGQKGGKNFKPSQSPGGLKKKKIQFETRPGPGA